MRTKGTPAPAGPLAEGREGAASSTTGHTSTSAEAPMHIGEIHGCHCVSVTIKRQFSASLLIFKTVSFGLDHTPEVHYMADSLFGLPEMSP